MEAVCLIIGLLLGAVAAYFVSRIVFRSKGAASVALLDAERRSRSEEREQHAAQVSTLKQEHANALANLKRECEERISAAKVESEKRLETAKREAEAHTAKVSEEGARNLSEAKDEHQRKLQAASADFEKRVADLRKEMEKRLDEVKGESKRQLEDAKAAHRADKELFEKQIRTTRQEGAELLATTKREYEQLLASSREDAAKSLQQSKREAEEQRVKELGELQKRYDTLLQQFKTEVTAATEKLLKERSGELQQANTQKMDELFKPIRDNIQRMEQSMNANREATVQSQTRFEDAMKQMMESNERLGNEADRLSTALQRKNKIAGNWGELILTELLESQGLEAGVHFDAQKAYKDAETGATKIPDVVLHLADNRDVIVDSKMSLTAFVDYQNAESEEQREEALARHLASVREHIKELTDKTYASAIAKPRVSADFVIMFVPIEGALQLAMSAEPSLWREAFDKKVFIAGGQTLIAALRIIDLTWVNVLQNRNTQNVMDEARKLIDRVCSFYEKFQDLGKKLSDAAKAYDVADQRVKTGSRSILALGNRLEELGARGKKALPRPDALDGSADDFAELPYNG